MKIFEIEIQEFLARVVEVNATNIGDALEMVENEYKKCTHLLDYKDFVEVNFIDINQESVSDKKERLTKDIINYLWKDEQKHFE